MARLEIELTPEEEERLRHEAQGECLPLTDWARRRLLGPMPVTFTTDDGEVYVIPNLPADLGRATALASEAALRKFWDAPTEDVAWRDM